MHATPVPFRARRALGQLLAVAAAAVIAASTWAAGVQEEGYLLDAGLWHSEVAGAAASHWPRDGWYRLALGDQAIEVQVADPQLATVADEDEDRGWYVRIPGLRLQTGARALYRMAAPVAQPALDREYQLMFGRTPFGFTVEDGNGSLNYAIRYDGAEHLYRLGRPGDPTAIRSIVDLDGDGRPDFVVDVDDQTYLLLSGTARPGVNLPSAQLWAAAHDGC
ncbi:hypothetical protein PE066_12930 [Ramlibacter tataouinensis]|uniref:hypothetical protein n=1 Tax=Ramlibacter tataouinensis TaxID=94132 RepID=UPI0022F3DE5D|nr:hypothetical protein [Ramlibacter tataouinensis]WBY00377.1 hypothetical protein PE066_12930 [Ramlibacter tataouinensis]